MSQTENGISKDPEGKLILKIKSGPSIDFSDLFQRGFQVVTAGERSLKDFLSTELGLLPSYIDERVQTMFLDGRAVDDPDRAVVSGGSTVSLSAAMPGLLGATLRRGSYYAAMRKEISYKARSVKAEDRNNIVTVKLFNLMAREIAPELVLKGVWLSGKDLAEFLKGRSDLFGPLVETALLNGKETPSGNLIESLSGMERVFFRIAE